MSKKKVVKQMTDTKVTHVSLVENPANEESFLMMKSSGENVMNIVVKEENIIKSESDEKKIVYGIVYSPDKLDSDAEFMSADDIEKSAHTFLSDFRNIDGNHDFVTKCGEPVESSILVADTEYNGRVVKKGSWVLAVKCTDEAWEKVKKGEFTGFSLAGKTKKKTVEVTVDDEGNVIADSVLKSAVNSILEKLGFVKKDFSKELENAENNNLMYYMDLLWYAIYDILWNDNTPEEKKAEIKKSLSQFMEKVNGMTFVYKNKKENEEVGGSEMNDELKGILEGIQKSVSDLNAKLEAQEVETKKSVEGLQKVTENIIAKMVTVEKASMNSAQVVEPAESVKKEKKVFNPLTGGYNG